MRLFNVATCVSRTQKQYKNKQMSWADFVKALSHPVRTQESAEEYKSLSKAEKGRLKDAGGFVAGYLEGGLRTKVKSRSMLCLDMDNAKADAWNVWMMAFGSAAVLYSTHSHTPEKPRFRLVVALSRDVDPDEYEAVGRKIAEILGLDMFDPTTFQPQRLMFWPSCPKDGEFVFEHEDGEALDPDEVLSLYTDWRDVSSWPTSSAFEKLRAKSEKKAMQAIEEKRGAVGVFCRAYDIHAAIAAFVPDYQRSESDPTRYTYTKGSTSNGVVTYNDTFSFSHHATDPASSREVNAFDLVRLHRFGDLDEEADIDTPLSKLPSYKAMCNLVMHDGPCLRQLAREEAQRAESAMDDFEDETGEGFGLPKKDAAKVAEGSEAEEPEDDSWTEQIQRSDSGKAYSNYNNIELILRNDSYFKGLFGFDDFLRRAVLLKDAPWRKVTKGDTALRDLDDAHVRSYLDKRYGITGKDKIFDGLQMDCARHRFHPIRDYLRRLTWDGAKRLDTMFVDYFGCEDSDYTRAITRKMMVAAVKRVFEPGCQFDNMLTLKGPQGCGKSSFFRKLSRGWFSDSLKDIRTKDALEGLQGAWFVEMGELSALKKAEAESIKSFLSGTVDRFRQAYGRRTEDYPRQCVFVGTTNEVEFLRDRTGNRRFWIIYVPKGAHPKKDVFAITDEDINQLWAEAYALYLSGETVVLGRELEMEALRIQENFMQEDPRAARIAEYLEKPLPEASVWREMSLIERREYLKDTERQEREGVRMRDKVCAAEVWCEALDYDDVKDMKRFDAVEINQILDSFPEWERSQKPQRFTNGWIGKGFVRVKM